jgi:ABC-type Fe3+-hydroxamate transport system substrate-binding protein
LPVMLTSAMLIVACGTSERTVYTADEVRSPTTTALVVPLTTVAPTVAPAPTAPTAPTAPSRIVFDQLSSPENAIAEIIGTGASPGDTVTVDDTPTDFVSFESSQDGGFVARVFIADEGAHTVCIATTCGRVFTLDPNAESIDAVELKIADAQVAASQRFDFAATFPEWTLETAGPFSGTGGTTDIDTKTVTIYSNRERTVDDFTRTILHEWGHVLDAERLSDDERASYLALREIAPDTPWSDPGDHSIESWALQPSEDFAEVMAMFWSEGQYLPRTETLAAPPTADMLDAIAALVDL